MAVLITLDEDGPLGPAGTQVWVDEPPAPAKPRKTTAKKSSSSKK